MEQARQEVGGKREREEERAQDIKLSLSFSLSFPRGLSLQSDVSASDVTAEILLHCPRGIASGDPRAGWRRRNGEVYKES